MRFLLKYLPSLNVSGFTRALAECGRNICALLREATIEIPHHRHRLLLRTRRERRTAAASRRLTGFLSPRLTPYHIVLGNAALCISANWPPMAEIGVIVHRNDMEAEGYGAYLDQVEERG
jgi:hypothetical protein